MPHGIYEKIECSSEKEGEFVEQPHQGKTRDAFMKSDAKGMVLYHKLGSGKTCTSILIADAMLDAELIKKVYVLTPGSLRKGWIEEYCAKCGLKSKRLKKRFVFITYNYGLPEIEDFNDSLVIVDEFHNLIRGASNESKVATMLYNTILKSNCRVLLLSGTPIIKNIKEWGLIGNLIRPDSFPDTRLYDEDKKTKLNEARFITMFNIDAKGRVAVAPQYHTIIRDHMKGVISYFPGAGEEFYPKVTHEEVIRTQMTHDQTCIFWIINYFESQLRLTRPTRNMYDTEAEYKTATGFYIMACKYILTRSASNYLPSGYSQTEGLWKRVGKEDVVIEAIEDEPKDPEKKEKVEEVLKKKLPDKSVEEGGWIEDGLLTDEALREKYSPKFYAIIQNIKAHPNEKHVLFTFFKSSNGAYMLKYLCAQRGIKAEVFSGDQDDFDRTLLLQDFNNVENRDGSKVQVLIITDAGAEGINILEARHMHIVESSTDEYRIKQAIGRVVRFKSHYAMPKEQQKVSIWRYFSTTPSKEMQIRFQLSDQQNKVLAGKKAGENKIKTIKVKEDSIAVDQDLYNKGQLLATAVETFEKILQGYSI
jgi:superfamily II DNA or RNA helicase